MEATPFVSVIIPTYHDWDRLKLCLNALAQQSYPIDRFEVLVVNNDPDDRPSYVVASGNVRLLEEAKPGSYAARNAAIRVAKGEVFAFTDSDCMPDQDWLRNGVQGLANGNDRIAGRIQIFCANDKPTVAEAYELVFAFNQKTNAENGASVTANLICYQYCFEKTGLFNCSLLSGGDIEWGYRANDQGFSISYQENAMVRHPARSSFADLLKKRRRVAGGAQAIESVKQEQRSLIRGLMPPIRAFKAILISRRISVWHKLALLPVSYYLKLFSTFAYRGSRHGWLKPTRQ